MPHRRGAEEDLGAGLQGDNWNQVDADFPDQDARRSSGPAPTRARSTTSPTRSTARRAPAAPTTQASEDDNVIVQGVSGSKGGLGYFGFSYYEENQDTLKALEVDGGSGCVAPSVETRPGRLLHAAVAAAVRLREERVARSGQRSQAFLDYMLDNATAIAESRAVRAAHRGAADRSRRRDFEAATAGEARGGNPGRSPPRRADPAARRRRRRHRRGRRSRSLLGLCALVSVATTVGIVVALLVPAIEFFREINPMRLLHRHELGAALRARPASASSR